jgi:hypothetical protein
MLALRAARGSAPVCGPLPWQGEGLTALSPVLRGSRRDEGRPEINATPAARRTKSGSSIFHPRLGACPGNSKKRSGQGASSSIRWTV